MLAAWLVVSCFGLVGGKLERGKQIHDNYKIVQYVEKQLEDIIEREREDGMELNLTCNFQNGFIN